MTRRMAIDDLWAWEHLLTEEEKSARDSVRQWVRERFMPVIQEAHRHGQFPKHLVGEMAELGVFGASLEGYGCAGMTPVAYGLVLQELERGDSGLRSMCSVQGSLVMYPIYAFGDESQRERWLPGLASGQLVGCFGLTEPNAGSDPAAMKTTAELDGDAYILNGIKCWITNSPIADLAIIWAKVKNEDDRIRGFVVERGTEGFSTPDIEGKFSLRASETGEIHLNDCRIPKSHLLPETGGLKYPLGCLTQARFGISFGATGAAIDCFETVLEYGQERIAFNKPIASFQLYQDKLAEMATKIVNSQLLSLHYGRLKERGELTPAHVSVAKRHNVRAAREIAIEARSMLGGIGITDAYSVMRHLMNIESVYTYEGTHEVHTLAIGRALTGINAFAG